jgi:uncharacterized tellurite resistance protein B-like protein
MQSPLYKEAILCLMFAMAEADATINNDELIAVITMKDVFRGYSEADIMELYREYKNRFADAGFAGICNVMVRQIPSELHMGTLSILADMATIDFDVSMQEGSFISIAAATMGISDIAVKTLLLTSLSRKLLLQTGEEGL